MTDLASLRRRVFRPEDDAWMPDLLDQASRLIVRSSLASPTTVLLVLGLLWRESPRRGLVVWALLTLAIALWQVLFFGWYQRRRDQLPSGTWLRLAAGSMALGGLTWGSLPILALPASSRTDWQAMIGLFVVAFMAANTIFSSPLCRLFHAFQLPLVALATAGFLIDGSGMTVLLAIVVLYAYPFSAVLHHQGNASAIAAVSLSHRNDALLSQLHDERRRIEQANQELLAVNQQLAHQANHDSLTGLANRLLFSEHLDHALGAARRRSSRIGVLFFDVDRFKVINDSLGHAAGDDLLVAVADRVLGRLRPGDVLARLGGDEFTVLLASLDDPRDAVDVAERVRLSAMEPFDVQGRSVQASVSVGLAFNLDPNDTADDLLRHADAAMYRAKLQGRNRVEVFDENLRASLARRLDEEAEVRQAFARSEVVTWFQPEVELETRTVLGAESLVRWMHPVRGVVSAGGFVPLAEECGLLHEIAKVSANDTMSARLGLADVVDESFRLRLNVAASQLTLPELLDGYLARLGRDGIDPSRISFEVTETAVIADLPAARHWLERARAAGIRVALDDFGTGYSSLALLAQLPLDGVKIDLSFVRELTSSVAARAVVSSTVELARVLELEVVAEGVETEEQARLLLELGVRRAQGYLYSPAVPYAELRRMIIGAGRRSSGEPAFDASGLSASAR